MILGIPGPFRAIIVSDSNFNKERLFGRFFSNLKAHNPSELSHLNIIPNVPSPNFSTNLYLLKNTVFNS